MVSEVVTDLKPLISEGFRPHQVSKDLKKLLPPVTTFF